MGAAVQQIADWLEKLGMSEYAQRFAENGINVAALPHLTDQDLKDIGVLLGYRRVMLAAISKLAGAAPATPEPTVRAESQSQDSAERRRVPVMFSDLVGSTALSARMDPEDLHEVISSYQKCVAEIVRRLGRVAKYMGDGGRNSLTSVLNPLLQLANLSPTSLRKMAREFTAPASAECLRNYYQRNRCLRWDVRSSGGTKRQSRQCSAFGGTWCLISRFCVQISRFVIVLFLLLSDAGLSFVAAQVQLDAAYTATLLGLPIGQISWTVELWDNQYSAVATGAISGLLRIFSDGRGEITAHGTMSGGRPVGSDFALRLVAGKWSDDVRIVFRGDKAKEYVANAPTNPDPNQVPLTDANRRGVADPMTAMFVYIPGAGEMTVPHACERTVAVFDGHTRYDLQLAFKRLDQVKTEKGYQGPVVVCSAKFVPVAGYDPKRYLFSYMAAQRDMEIWLAPFAGSRLMVPYRVSMPTPFGLGLLQATKFESLPARSPTTVLR